MTSAGQRVPDSRELAQRLPGYRIEAELGRGNMGVVYLAEDLTLRRTVALKVLAPKLAADERFRQRFSRESQMAANLDHPSVISVYSAGESDGLFYIAMRYVDGSDLGKLLRTSGRFDLPRAVSMVAQIGAALDHAHAAGLVHRDVKPANILFARESGRAYLCDFGIAKHAASTAGLTSTGMFVGTLAYISPEQIQGRTVDGRADLYALGCVLFHCLTGVVPYDREDASAVLFAHLVEVPPKVTGHRPELPAAVDAVVATAMAKEPDDRFATGAEFAEALRRGAKGASRPAAGALGVGGRPPDPPTAEHAAQAQRLPPRGRRRRARRTAGVAAALVLALAVAAMMGTLRRRAQPVEESADGGAGLIATVAGNGVKGFSGDGRPAVQAALNNPDDAAVAADGSLYIADLPNHRVRKVDPTGVIATVAGTGEQGLSGDGGPAVLAALNKPVALAIDEGGSLYFADLANHRVARIDAAGVIATVAGTGGQGFSGDGGPAVQAALNNPADVAVAADGSLYIADMSNDRIRRVSATGVITTVAGNGVEGFSGDGGPATEAALDSPTGLAMDAGGTLYIADSGNQRIRRVDPAGTITTVAGTGVEGFTGDGGPATAARLDSPVAVALAADGGLWIADRDNHRIRAIRPDGTIATVAGTGRPGYSGDGGPAADAALNRPAGLAVDASGALYVADTDNNRIRRIAG